MTPMPWTAAPIPLPRDWAPNPQHLSRVAARGLDLAAVVEAFRQYADGKTRTGVDKWDKAFGWWLKPGEGWDKHGRHTGRSRHCAIGAGLCQRGDARQVHEPPWDQHRNAHTASPGHLWRTC
ncbi:hypothetical protein GS891_27970 [Rhodococcus hoagii]|nr:hypothetical protein [Prescottella equi]